jgi:hypothetical protein
MPNTEALVIKDSEEQVVAVHNVNIGYTNHSLNWFKHTMSYLGFTFKFVPCFLTSRVESLDQVTANLAQEVHWRES